MTTKRARTECDDKGPCPIRTWASECVQCQTDRATLEILQRPYFNLAEADEKLTQNRESYESVWRVFSDKEKDEMKGLLDSNGLGCRDRKLGIRQQRQG